MGTVAGAVYTVTLEPPPCGTSAIDRTLTPIVAQSSVDASLNSIETLPVWGVDVVVEVLGGVVAPPLEPPPPQAAINTASAPTDNIRNVLGTMINVSSKLTINIPWQLLAIDNASLRF